jgi:small subunit ribosomal protein S19
MVIEVAKKDLYFKGVKHQDLAKLTSEQLGKLVNSRARRSLKRGLTFDQKILIGKVDEAVKIKSLGKETKMIKTHSRDAIVIPKMIGLTIGVHSGRKFEPVDIKPEMVGHYLGEFALTRQRVVHGKTAAAEAAAAAAGAAPAESSSAKPAAPKTAEKKEAKK